MRDHIGEARDYKRPDNRELRELGRRHRARPPLTEAAQLTSIERRVLIASTNRRGVVPEPAERVAAGRLTTAGWVKRAKTAVIATEAGRKALRSVQHLTAEVDDVPRLKQRDGITSSSSLAVRGPDGDEVVESTEDRDRRAEEERLMALDRRQFMKTMNKNAKKAA